MPAAELVEEFVVAAHSDLPKVMEMLGREPELLNERWQRHNESALDAAAHVGRRDIVEYLLGRGAPTHGYVAASLGRTEEVKRCLQQDPALANAPAVHGMTLLYHAALSGNLELLDLIHEAGGREGLDRALHAAARYGHAPAVAWLLAHGARELSIRNSYGKTPLEVATEKGYRDIAAMLREHGATT